METADNLRILNFLIKFPELSHGEFAILVGVESVHEFLRFLSRVFEIVLEHFTCLFK